MGLILLTYKGGFGNNRKLPEDLRQCKVQSQRPNIFPYKL